MGVTKGYSFEKVYERYLAWFRERADGSANPKRQEELLKYQMCNEDVFESSTLLINRLFFFVPLLPSESKSGALEVFAFSELNLLKRTASDEVEDITPIEYTVYTK